MNEAIKNYTGLKKPSIREYGLLYFDHLRGERLIIDKPNPVDLEIYKTIEAKRVEQKITWDDIYAYQLLLLEHQDFETLKSKIISLRIKYQNLVDIAEYNNYMTMRGVKLSEPAVEKDIEKLKADYKFLLDEFYLRYAYASTYEDLRTRLLRWVGVITFLFLLFAVSIGILTLGNGAIFRNSAGEFEGIYRLVPYLLNLKDYYSTLFVVVFAGIIGAFVSIQQRFQSASRQGDPIYSLALLTHGWFSIFLSPLSGAIFAAMLYLFFAGGLLSGTIFPKLTETESPPSSTTSQQIQPRSADAKTMGITEFSISTGPKDSTAFALLIIWSFIAGFAERFVPDTLMRLVNQKKASESATA